MMRILQAAFALAFAVALASSAGGPAGAGELPDGFVFLADLDPGIVQSMDYAGPENFTRARVPGYEAAECILSAPVAAALVKVQEKLAADKKTLIVHDCYRPAQAVRHFVRWAKETGAGRDRDYHPSIDRNRLVAQGYIAERSGHSSGGSVDVSFGTLGPDGSVQPAEMGGRFDLFDESSHTASLRVPPEARRNRKFLVEAMASRGFANYRREWWHFRFRADPFTGQSFDVPVSARRR